MSAACPLCAASESIPHLEKFGFTLVRCTVCGLIYTRPMPDTAALQAHYDNPAYFSGQSEQGYRHYADMRRALRPHFDRRLKQLEQMRPGRGRLLDVGCADGYFLELAQAKGWQVAGVELSEAMARQSAQRLGAPVVSDLAMVDDAGFEAITLWEVIEHLPDPLAQLRRARAKLRPGGVLMLSTPNTGHWQAQRQPDRWVAYRPPSHLIYFTAATLRAMLERGGFQHVHVRPAMPLPPLPAWLDRSTRGLQAALAGGSAPAWPLALLAWRAVRVLGLVGHRLSRSTDDIFTTLEVTATNPPDAG